MAFTPHRVEVCGINEVAAGLNKSIEDGMRKSNQLLAMETGLVVMTFRIK